MSDKNTEFYFVKYGKERENRIYGMYMKYRRIYNKILESLDNEKEIC